MSPVRDRTREPRRKMKTLRSKDLCDTCEGYKTQEGDQDPRGDTSTGPGRPSAPAPSLRMRRHGFGWRAPRLDHFFVVPLRLLVWACSLVRPCFAWARLPIEPFCSGTFHGGTPFPIDLGKPHGADDFENAFADELLASRQPCFSGVASPCTGLGGALLALLCSLRQVPLLVQDDGLILHIGMGPDVRLFF